MQTKVYMKTFQYTVSAYIQILTGCKKKNSISESEEFKSFFMKENNGLVTILRNIKFFVNITYSHLDSKLEN